MHAKASNKYYENFLIMKRWICILTLLSSVQIIVAQEPVTKGFNRENLFTGGNFSLGFSSNVFAVGVHPEIGYSLKDWTDVGILFNFSHSSSNDPNYGIKYHYSVYGAGLFTRLYPVKFLFAQAQAEQNFVQFKEHSGNADEKTNVSAGSVLIGGGIAIGRKAGLDKVPFFYIAVLTEIAKNRNSPYLNYNGRTFPIMRIGLYVPLFGKKHASSSIKNSNLRKNST